MAGTCRVMSRKSIAVRSSMKAGLENPVVAGPGYRGVRVIIWTARHWPMRVPGCLGSSGSVTAPGGGCHGPPNLMQALMGMRHGSKLQTLLHQSASARNNQRHRVGWVAEPMDG